MPIKSICAVHFGFAMKPVTRSCRFVRREIFLTRQSRHVTVQPKQNANSSTLRLLCRKHLIAVTRMAFSPMSPTGVGKRFLMKQEMQKFFPESICTVFKHLLVNSCSKEKGEIDEKVLNIVLSNFLLQVVLLLCTRREILQVRLSV